MRQSIHIETRRPRLGGSNFAGGVPITNPSRLLNPLQYCTHHGNVHWPKDQDWRTKYRTNFIDTALTHTSLTGLEKNSFTKIVYVRV